jgi:hypothetical protein
MADMNKYDLDSTEYAFVEEMLARAYQEAAAGRDESATDGLVDKLDQLLCNSRFDVARHLLEKLDCARLPPCALTGTLVISRSAARELGGVFPSFLSKTLIALREKWLWTEEQLTQLQARLK